MNPLMNPRQILRQIRILTASQTIAKHDPLVEGRAGNRGEDVRTTMTMTMGMIMGMITTTTRARLTSLKRASDQGANLVQMPTRRCQSSESSSPKLPSARHRCGKRLLMI